MTLPTMHDTLEAIASSEEGAPAHRSLVAAIARIGEISAAVAELKGDVPTEKETISTATEQGGAIARRAEAYAEAKKALRAEYRDIFFTVHGKAEVDTAEMVAEGSVLHGKVLKTLKYLEDVCEIPCVNSIYAEIPKIEGVGMRSKYVGYFGGPAPKRK